MDARGTLRTHVLYRATMWEGAMALAPLSLVLVKVHGGSPQGVSPLWIYTCFRGNFRRGVSRKTKLSKTAAVFFCGLWDQFSFVKDPKS